MRYSVLVLLVCSWSCASQLPGEDDELGDAGANAQGTPGPGDAVNGPEANGPEANPPEADPADPDPEANAPEANPGAIPEAPANPDPEPQDHAAFCRDRGPIVEVPFGDVAREVCAGEIAEALFGQALCVCEDYHAGGGLFTRAFDSRFGEPIPDGEEGGGSVGINGRYLGSHGINAIGGSLVVASDSVNHFLGGMHVGGDLRLGGDAHQPLITTVGRDAWLGGGFFGGPFHVGRDLRHGGGIASLHNTVGGANSAEAVEVEPPCDCAAPFDASVVVDQLQRDNENALVGLDPSDLSNVGLQHRIELPCGRYFVDEISGVGDVVIAVTGRVALAVAGDVRVAGSLRFEIADGAELDLFVGGTLVLIGHHRFGDAARPAAMRMYVASDEAIHLVGGNALALNLYAPRAHVQTIGVLHLLGSIFARTMVSGGVLDITYDRAITEIDCGEDEPEDGGGRCKHARECVNGAACIDNLCQACGQDSDCGNLDVCDAGRCQPI